MLGNDVDRDDVGRTFDDNQFSLLILADIGGKHDPRNPIVDETRASGEARNTNTSNEFIANDFDRVADLPNDTLVNTTAFGGGVRETKRRPRDGCTRWRRGEDKRTASRRRFLALEQR